MGDTDGPGPLCGNQYATDFDTLKYMLKRTKHNIKNDTTTGQVILEFTFSMIIIMLMIYAAIKIFLWAGSDLVERRIDHDRVLTQVINEDWGGCVSWNCTGPLGSCQCLAYSPISSGPIQQIDPYFHKPLKMNAVWAGY